MWKYRSRTPPPPFLKLYIQWLSPLPHTSCFPRFPRIIWFGTVSCLMKYSPWGYKMAGLSRGRHHQQLWSPRISVVCSFSLPSWRCVQLCSSPARQKPEVRLRPLTKSQKDENGIRIFLYNLNYSQFWTSGWKISILSKVDCALSSCHIAALNDSFNKQFFTFAIYIYIYVKLRALSQFHENRNL